MSGVAEMSPKNLMEGALNAIPVGYKQSEVGIIPEDWETKPLGELVEIYSGDSPSKFVFSTEGTPYFKVEQLNNGSVYADTTPYFIQSSKKVLAGSVIFPKRGASILSNKIRVLKHDSFMDTNLMALTCHHGLDELFLYNQLTYRGLDSVADTTSIPQINNKHISPYLVPLPRKAEQTAIANALFDADALISELEKLIAKKQAIKTATMQQLLTGRTRLPQFALREGGTPKGTKPSELGEIPEDWEINYFAECGYFQSGSGFPTKYQGEQEGDYPFFKVSDMNNIGNEIFLISSNNYISESVKNSISVKVIPENAIVFAKIGAAIFLERKKICFQSSCIDNNMMAYIANEDQLQFKYAYLLFKNINLGQLVEATALPSLSGRDIGQKRVALPAAEEQTAIATILSDMDAEIQALEQRLGKTRQIKQGMMQELLTGKTRLIKLSKEVIHE